MLQNYKFCVIPFNDLRMERETGLEPVITMKLLFYYVFVSGKRDSNPRPPAWKASALSTELFPQERSFYNKFIITSLNI